MKTFDEFNKYIDKNTIFIGHSVGCAFLLNVLENIKKPIRATFLVAPFTGLLPKEDLNPLIESFSNKNFDWKKIKKNSKKFYIICSTNDPYVPAEKGRFIAKNLGSKVIAIKDGGHLNKNSGYDRFDLLLELILKEL
jgi:uncharacterized protein